MSEDERHKKVSEYHKKLVGEMYASVTASCTPASSIAPCTHDKIDRNVSEISKHPHTISIKADESGLANILPMQY